MANFKNSLHTMYRSKTTAAVLILLVLFTMTIIVIIAPMGSLDADVDRFEIPKIVAREKHKIEKSSRKKQRMHLSKHDNIFDILATLNETQKKYLNILNFDERIQYYMGKWYHSGLYINQTWESFRNIHFPRSDWLFHYSIHNNTANDNTLQQISDLGNHTHPKQIYTSSFLKFLYLSHQNNITNIGDAILNVGDDTDLDRWNYFPIFGKARKIKLNKLFDNNIILLQTLKYKRHWAHPCNIYNHLARTKMNKQFTVRWRKKYNQVIFRGAATGRHLRVSLVKQYINSNKFGIDVGLTKIHILNNSKYNQYNYSELIKLKTSKKHENKLMRYKYVVSIEGNDVATNLKWILMANSVPFMLKPTKETYLMEGLLREYIHYIPLNFTTYNETNNKNQTITKYKWNLEEQYKFCLENERFCKQIALNAQLFMIGNQFCDPNTMKKTELRVLQLYCKQNELFFT